MVARVRGVEARDAGGGPVIGIIIGAMIGGHIGGKLGEKYLDGTTETPYWTGHIAGDTAQPAVTITQFKHRGKVGYRLYVVTEGQYAQVATGEYPAVLAALQTWEKYIAKGGTVTAWLAQNAQRAAEVADLEQSL